MDAFILFVVPPLFGLILYYLMTNDLVQFMIEYMKRKMKEDDKN
tara:strand:- start:162 stop:293 length:132 start_codon:yes stop_codon:yes gene_type:complete